MKQCDRYTTVSPSDCEKPYRTCHLLLALDSEVNQELVPCLMMRVKFGLTSCSPAGPNWMPFGVMDDAVTMANCKPLCITALRQRLARARTAPPPAAGPPVAFASTFKASRCHVFKTCIHAFSSYSLDSLLYSLSFLLSPVQYSFLLAAHLISRSFLASVTHLSYAYRPSDFHLYPRRSDTRQSDCNIRQPHLRLTVHLLRVSQP